MIGKMYSLLADNPAGLVLLFVLTLLSACASLHEPTVPEPEPVHVLSPERPFGPSTPLAVFLNQALERQYPARMQSFIQPEKHGQYFVELAREQVQVHLVNGVRSYAAGAEGLAAGMHNGDILIWSDWPCPALTLPEAAPVDLLAWDGSSAFLGASNFRRKTLDIFDLRFCARIGTVPSEGPISVAAVSHSGTWAAYVDHRQRLLAGPVDGTLNQGGVLRFQPLALAFSPREGLLFSVDQAGWLLHWQVPELQILEQVLIPQGPFQEAVFDGRHLLLRPMRLGVDISGAETSAPDHEESMIAWDIPSSTIIPLAKPSTHAFALESDLLMYQTAQRRWIRKMHLGRPQPRIWASPSIALLRLRDVDGVVRCYSANDGLPVDADQCQAQDWQELGVDPSWRFDWGGVEYALADPVRVMNGLVLYCRSLSKDRFVLWWDEAEQKEAGPDAAIDRTGRLPVRQSLRLEIPPSWVRLPYEHEVFEE